MVDNGHSLTWNDSEAMTQLLRPSDPAQLAELVAQAGRTRIPVWTQSGDSKWDWGCRQRLTSAPDPTRISLSALTGIISYEPGELILVVGAATPLSQIQQLLADEGQHLAFEPVLWRETATAGGAVATGLAGPRRFRAGGVRDFVLGLQFVDGRGRLVRSGGRVVKNVSGYDLWRGLTGSFGELGLLTEICFKLWPRPQTERTLRITTPTRVGARQLMLDLAQSQQEITGLAYTPDQHVLVRLEGSHRALDSQVDAVAGQVAAGQGGASQVEADLTGDESTHLWSNLREVKSLRGASGPLWRFVIPATHWVDLLNDLCAAGVERYQIDWGGGLVWALAPPDGDLNGHDLAHRQQGIAWRVASTPSDLNPAAMPPLSPGLERLNQRLRSACDPHEILNTGRSGL